MLQVVLMVSGIAIALLAVSAARFRRPALSGVAALVALVSGASLNAVDVVISNSVIYRSYSVFDLRGTVPWVAAIACLSALGVAAVLTLILGVTRLLAQPTGPEIT